MPVFGLLILFNVPTIPYSFKKMDALFFFSEPAKLYILIVIGVLTLLAPVLSLLIMKRSGIISSLKVENREERVYPFVITIFYYVLAFLFVRNQLPEIYQHPSLLSFMFAAVVIFITLFIVNFYVKVSLHAAGVFALSGGLLGYFQTQNLLDNQGDFLIFIVFLIGLGGLVSSGRVYLKAHTLGETTLGMLVGFLVAYVSVRFGVYI